MNILFVTQYGSLAASSRTRVFQYLPYLHQQGVRTRVITVLPDRAIAGSQVEVTRNQLRKIAYYIWASWRTSVCSVRAWWAARQFDVLFIQKVIFPAPVRWLLRAKRPIVIYDFDDAIFTTEVRRRHWLASWKERRNARGLPAMLRLADRAVVENDYTEAFAATYCSTFRITGPIDTEAYACAHKNGHNGRAVVLGWMGSATTRQYLDLIRRPLGRLAERFPDLRLEVVGAHGPDLNGLTVDWREWDLEREQEDLRGFDIGLMPIADDAWTRGKGGYKLLQYMAVGLPVVTSPVGINREIVTHGQSGFWAENEAEWEDRLAQLVEDSRLRRDMGARGRSVVEARYALALHQERLHAMLITLCAEPEDV